MLALALKAMPKRHVIRAFMGGVIFKMLSSDPFSQVL